VGRTLDLDRNPFFEHADARLYLAWRDGRAVGRIAAIVNYLHNNYHAESVGFWGFFETERDPAVAGALLERAADELRERGMTEMRGPFSPSINAECGLLIDGFNLPPAVMMPYNPSYYPDLVEQAGLAPLKDLHAYLLVEEQAAADRKTIQRLERLAQAVRRRHPNLTVRPLDMSNYEADVIALGELFNTLRRGNWGFVPVTEPELRLLAREMKSVVEPDMVLVAELDGKPVGCVISLPDINPLLKKLNGRLFPFGWAHLLWRRRIVRRVRILGSGVLPAHRLVGVVPLLFYQLIRNGQRHGYEAAELSWVAEDNVNAVRTLESAVKPRLYKRYRIYTRQL